MSLRQRIDEDLKAASESGDGARLAGVRALASAVKVREIELTRPADDAEVQGIAARLVKERREAAAPEAEIKALESYLPPAV